MINYKAELDFNSFINLIFIFPDVAKLFSHSVACGVISTKLTSHASTYREVNIWLLWGGGVYSVRGNGRCGVLSCYQLV